MNLSSMRFFSKHNVPLSGLFVVRIFLIFCGFLLLLQTAKAQNLQQKQSNLTDKIVVVVNDDVITETELELRILRVKINNNIEVVDDELTQKVLENMVQEKVQLQRADEVGLFTSDAEVNSLLQQFARQRNISVEQLQEQLAREGLPFKDFVDDLRSQSTIRKLVRSSIASQITVTDEEIETYTKANNIKPKDIAYELSYLLAEYPLGATDEQKDLLLEEISSIKRQISNENFEKINNFTFTFQK